MDRAAPGRVALPQATARRLPSHRPRRAAL